MNTSIQSFDLSKVLKLADKNHWGFRVSDEQGMIDHPKYQDQWWYIPISEDEKIIHENAKMRIEAIKRSGVKIQGLILGHEAPRLLQAPPHPPKVIEAKQAKPKPDFSFLPSLLLYLGMAMLVDPALFVVLDDGTWVEVMTWYE